MGSEKPGVCDADGRRFDLSAHFDRWDGKFFATNGLARLAELCQERNFQFPVVATAERWGAPIARPGKIVCIGLNYSDHAAESGMPIPAEPIVFLKASNTMVGPFDNVQIPRGSSKTDWEVELGVVIGTDARYLDSEQQALHCIAGYGISHDVSEREFQLERGGQWTKGKSCDTFNPFGPWLATPDEIPDPHDLRMELSVNGQRRQSGTTAAMLFRVPTLIYYLSQFMTLEPGDLISTGTPPGVGLGMKPPTYLTPGDDVELTIEGLGRQRQHIVAIQN
jgi:2-keto-4-pentenoate hydratase/2-oxohepta-3-ene-1,7-dioic acid hydratase in catechol pathway